MAGRAIACGLALAIAHTAHAVAGRAVPLCPTSQLHVSVVRVTGATSHRYWDLRLQNSGTSACRLEGYPGVGLLNRSGGLIPINVDRVRGFPVRSVTVPSGGRGYFTFTYVVGGPCGSRTFSAYGIQIIPPDQRTRLLVRRVAFDVCDVAVGGHPGVYPVRPTLARL
jgi:hypothetical protein